MTPQEIFDKAVGGVIAQGKLAIDPNRGCAYRTEDGAYRVNHRNDAKEIQDFIEAARQVALRNGLQFNF